MFKLKLIFLKFNYLVHVQIFCFVNRYSIFSLSPKMEAYNCTWKQGFKSLKIYHKTQKRRGEKNYWKIEGIWCWIENSNWVINIVVLKWTKLTLSMIIIFIF
jgi:hypothetical protein